MQAVLGQKIDQSQRFLEDGTRVPVTAIAVTDNPVVGVRTVEKNGYNAVQIGYGIAKKPTKALSGIAKKANLQSTPRVLKEVRIDDGVFPDVGTSITVSEVFKPGDIIQVTGISKGKGWAGGVKRWHFRGGPRTHGQSDRERAPGSIGQTTTPGRVYKGKKMAGRMGAEQVTVTNLTVVDVTDKTLLVSGLIPGPVNNIVLVKKTGEKKNFVPLFRVVEPEPEVPAEESQATNTTTPEAAQETTQAPESTPVQEAAAETRDETPATTEEPTKATEPTTPENDPKEDTQEEVKAASSEDNSEPSADANTTADKKEEK